MSIINPILFLVFTFLVSQIWYCSKEDRCLSLKPTIPETINLVHVIQFTIITALTILFSFSSEFVTVVFVSTIFVLLCAIFVYLWIEYLIRERKE